MEWLQSPFQKKSLLKSHLRLKRLATFSINLYFTLIAVIIASAFKIWILTLEESGLQSSFDLDFKNQGFDLCTCQLLEKFDLGCANNEANLQNYLDTLPIEILLYAFILIPLCCHFLQSMCTSIPPPMHMVDFLTGAEPEEERPIQSSNSFEMKAKSEVANNDNGNQNKSSKLCSSSYVLAILSTIISMLIVIVMCTPFGFNLFLIEYNHTQTSKYDNLLLNCSTVATYSKFKLHSSDDVSYCSTQDFMLCKFPFEYHERLYYDCVGSHNSTDKWCPISEHKDANGTFKEPGWCSANCPGSKISKEFCINLNLHILFFIFL